MKTKLAFIGIKGLPARAGADHLVEAIATRLDKQQYEVTAYCSSQHIPEGAHLDGVELLRIPTVNNKYLHSTLLFLLSALHALVLRRYDLVHVHNVEASFVLPLLRPKYRIMTTSQGSAYARDKWGTMAKTLLRMTEYPFIYLSNCVTSASQPLAEYYQRTYKKHVQYVPNGVEMDADVDEAGARAILDEHGLQPGQYILFAAGRILRTKGCHTLLEAYHALQSNMPLLVVGDATHNPAYSKELRAMADERVRFVPFIASQEVLAGIVRDAHLFVFPSTVEAMSMMLLEVAAMGVPLICSDIPENTHTLPEQATLFFKSEDAADLQDKLRWALAHPAEMQAYVRAARQWVMEHNNWDTIVSRYEALYRATLPQAQPASVEQ